MSEWVGCVVPIVKNNTITYALEIKVEKIS